MNHSSSIPFDAFHVVTWSCFIEQDDPRMITCELRRELESAFEVYPYSAKCRQSLLSSLILWAGLARAQRHVIQWNSTDNINLGQGLIQHLFDLTAEMQGINTDAIYAALRAERHPFLKEVYKVQQARGVVDGMWRGSDRCATTETKRDDTRPTIPTLHTEPLMPMSPRSPTALRESQSREEQLPRPSAEIYPCVPTPLTNKASPSTTMLYSVGYCDNETLQKAADIRSGVLSAKLLKDTTACGPTKRPPVSLPSASKIVANHANDKPLRWKGDTAKPADVFAAPSLIRDSLPPESVPSAAIYRLIHAVDTAPSVSSTKGVVAKPLARNGEAKPTASSKFATRLPAKADVNPTSATKPKVAAAAPLLPAPSAAKEPTPYVPKKVTYVYTDSDDSDDVTSSAVVHDTNASASASGLALPTPVTEALLKYGDGKSADLMQAFWNDLPADPDGVSVWFGRCLAITEDDRQVPLMAAASPPLCLDKVKQRMQSKVAKRLDQLFQYLHAEAPTPLPPLNEVAALLSARDIEQLEAAKLIRPCKQSAGPDTVLAFTVVEKATTNARRRFLTWPRGSNQHTIDSGYESHIPLHHISTYLDAVNESCGIVQSIPGCFDQVLLPPDLQERFVFTDARDHRWCLTRLPLGHTVSMEIVQIIVSTLSGHPSYTLQSYAAANAVRIDVWVYTARLCGPAKDVQAASAALRAACDECGAIVTTSWRDVLTSDYNFLGVHFDHSAHEVSVASDILSRVDLPSVSISTRDLERQYTQLLFCSSTLRVAASGYYTVLTEVCHRLGVLQLHPQQLHTPSELLPGVYMQLQKWREAVLKNTPRHVEAVTSPSMSLFVVLNKENCQAVLVSQETQETWNASMELEDTLGTRVASVAVTRAVVCFQPCIEKGTHVKIKVIGGEAKGPNGKPIYESEPEDSIAVCIRTHLVARIFSFEVAYLKMPGSAGGVAGDTAACNDAQMGANRRLIAPPSSPPPTYTPS
ncbi:hypothetical protein NXY56_006373 [Leishmania guyanensis]|uniref:Uncharacterized protein n=1 Tax=Leishmania guyanensis TaxID=5670 RepID=A0A1E1J5A6_LEIGU|nr:hypothetical protein BN36_3362640 [Leishmania guyanensis]